MSKLSYGQRNIINFANESELYEAIGYLANPSRNLVITSETYDNKWGIELRLNFYDISNIPPSLNKALSAGNTSYVARLNNNEFVRALVNSYNFQPGSIQNSSLIRSSIKREHLNNFDRGYNL